VRLGTPFFVQHARVTGSVSGCCRKIDILAGPSQLDNLVVVLVRPRNPLNIGAAARAMSNFGAQRLRLVNPYPVAFREVRSAVGASHVIRNAEEFRTVAAGIADCTLVVGTTAVRNRKLNHAVRQLDQPSGSAIRDAIRGGRVALLFGSEKTGLTNEDFSHCHWLLHIPTQEEHISMNLGQAVAVCLYEIARSSPAVVSNASPDRATAADAEQIDKTLLEALHKSGYVKPGNDSMCEKKVRELIRRLCLSSMDAKVLLGMVRQILWKLRQE
jgi:TrmH family RNA methyltransferase